MAELLIELYSEEIPANLQLEAERGFKELLQQYLKQEDINYQLIQAFSGPCRITIVAQGIDETTPAKTIVLRGPAVSAPEQAIEAFCRTHSAEKPQLFIQDLKGKPYYFYEQCIASQPTADAIAKIIPQIIKDYTWPKSMYWGDCSFNWVRPLRNILCLFAGRVIPVSYAHLTANNLTYGHKFLHHHAIEVTDFADYKQKLEQNFVMLSREDRANSISNQIQEICQQHKLQLSHDQTSQMSLGNQRVFDELLGLSEWPTVLLGEIPKQFLEIPSEVLITAMHKHQRYLSTSDRGEFAPYFIFVSNITVADPRQVIEGNQKVLNARLSDAAYFYNQDLKTELREFLPRLHNLVFHQKLGSVHDKTQRLIALSCALYPHNPQLAEAAQLCKADLVTAVVLEFPELQGIMGRYYAINNGCDIEVADAISKQYIGGNLEAAHTRLSRLLAFIDRLDSMVGLFLAGESATGSKDPYGLRRLAIGIINLIPEDLSLRRCLNLAIDLYHDRYPALRDKDEALSLMLSFITDRLKQMWKSELALEAEYLIDSVLDLTTEDNISIARSRLVALQDFCHSQQGYEFFTAYGRVTNVLRLSANAFDASLFNEYEMQLFNEIEQIRKVIAAGEHTYHKLNSLTEAINVLFDNVLINDSDPILAQNRQALLYYLVQSLKAYGDLATVAKHRALAKH